MWKGLASEANISPYQVIPVGLLRKTPSAQLQSFGISLTGISLTVWYLLHFEEVTGSMGTQKNINLRCKCNCIFIKANVLCLAL